jgi:hypothetical protein
MVQAWQIRPIALGLAFLQISNTCAGVQRFRLEIISPVDAGVRRFRGHCCRIHRISAELEWSECVPEFGHCRTCARSVPACDSRHCVANTNTNTDQARSSWRDVNETRPDCVACTEADAHTQGREPLHTRRGSPTCPGTRSTRPFHPSRLCTACWPARRVRTTYLAQASARVAMSPCLRSSCGTTCGRPSHPRTGPSAR